jgi:HD-like signal output (HDOD) protein
MVRGLDGWIRKLTKQNMPAVGKVIADLNALTGRDDTEINQLAEVILRDAHLTSHVLKVANSVHYNHSSSPINTVSRAIVLIGFKGVRAICISLLLIDSLLKNGPRDRLLQLMAQGLHAATQARDLVIRQDEEAAEEVFIAALLYHLGEMAFLANEKITDENSALLSDDSRDREAAMERVLGTSFKAITRALAKFWKLGETLESSLNPNREPGHKVKAVLLGERLSRAAVKGWDSSAARKVIDEISVYSMLDADQSLQAAQESAERAAEIALHYGAAEVCPLIPRKNCKAPAKKSAPQKILRGDAQLQLNILRELTTATAEKADVNTIFQMVIEGMHRGVGLERVAVAFIQQHQATAKYVLGEGTEAWRKAFTFDVGPYSDNIFTASLASPAALWLDATYINQHRHQYSPDIQQVLGTVPSFVYVLRVGDRTPGLFYADRGDFGGALSKDQFESFRHFASQAQINLNLLSQVVKKPTH